MATAMQVFAEKGPDAPVIDDFIRAAGIARGTFYNHFTSTQALLLAVSRSLEDRLIRAIEIEIATLDDPARRLATGVRLWLRWAQDDRVGCGFVVRSRFRGPLVEQRLTRDLRDGRRTGAFSYPRVEVARDLVVGTILEAMHRMLTARVTRPFIDDVTRVILQGLGLPAQDAQALLARPAPQLREPVRALT